MLNVRNLADRAYDVLVERIVTRDIRPGEAIRQDVIAAELGISKIPLREALARLEQVGLAHGAPHKGFIAAPLSADEAEDLFATRILLEPPTAAFASTRASPAERARVIEHLVGCASTKGARPGVRERHALVRDLIRPAGHRTVEALITPLFHRSERYISGGASEVGGDTAGLCELVEAWRAGLAEDVLQLYRAQLFSRMSAVLASMT